MIKYVTGAQLTSRHQRLSVPYPKKVVVILVGFAEGRFYILPGQWTLLIDSIIFQGAGVGLLFFECEMCV
jgi:hypothetical protein